MIAIDIAVAHVYSKGLHSKANNIHIIFTMVYKSLIELINLDKHKDDIIEYILCKNNIPLIIENIETDNMFILSYIFSDASIRKFKSLYNTRRMKLNHNFQIYRDLEYEHDIYFAECLMNYVFERLLY